MLPGQEMASHKHPGYRYLSGKHPVRSQEWISDRPRMSLVQSLEFKLFIFAGECCGFYHETKLVLMFSSVDLTRHLEQLVFLHFNAIFNANLFFFFWFLFNRGALKIFHVFDPLNVVLLKSMFLFASRTEGTRRDTWDKKTKACNKTFLKASAGLSHSFELQTVFTTFVRCVKHEYGYRVAYNHLVFFFSDHVTLM